LTITVANLQLINACTMQHRGQIVEKAVKQSNFSITEVARHCNVSRMTVYRFFEYADLDWDRIVEIYRLLGRSVHEDFPNAPGAAITQRAQEPEASYGINAKLQQCHQELIALQRDYTQLLTEYYKLKEQMS